MSIRSKIKKAQAQGYLRTIELIFNRFVPAWLFRFSMGDIYDFDVGALRALAGPKQPGDEFDTGVVTDSERRQDLREFTWSTVPIETTENDLGFAVYENGDREKILGGVWAGIDSFIEENLGIEFEFEEDQAWLYCAFVSSESRGKGVYKRLISFAAEELTNRGYQRVFGIVQPWNKISKRMHEQHSLGICGRMSAIRIFSFCWVFYRGNLKVDKRFVTQIKTSPAKVRIL